MKEQLRKYIDNLFEETAPTKKAVELKEEMIQNLEDKYQDLLNEGKSPESAYNIAIAGIGDISSLLMHLEEGGASDSEKEKLEKAKHTSALRTAIAVVLYILCVLPVLLLDHNIAVPMMFVLIAAATGILVYNNMTKPKYLKESDSVVEDFREWQYETHDRRRFRGALSTALWTLAIALFIIISFTTGAWHITWIIFVLAALCESFISIFFSISNPKGNKKGKRK